ncbi:MAG: DUF2807 domain-containing protein [Bacteroidaceae bacterium]|nr:DUF2807 domain-containing protein [Bacteroidaceae bacterium]
MKQKFSTLLAYLLLAPLTLISCGLSSADMKAIAESSNGEYSFRDSKKWGQVIKKDLNITADDINSIILKEGSTVYLTQGDAVSIVAEGNEKAIEARDISINDNVMTIDYKDKRTNIPEITLYITAPNVKNIHIDGTSDIDIKNKYIIDEDFNIVINGTGDLEIDKLECENINISINGTGDLDAKKITCKNSADISIHGTGDINADIKANSINTNIMGTGDADLKVECNTLYTSATGTGSIKLKGNAQNFKKHESAKGAIDSRNLKYNNKK